MNDQGKTTNQPIEEMAEMRRRVADVESLNAELRQQVWALQKSEARYRLIAENVGDVIWQLDPDFCFTYVSPSVEELLGYGPDEVIGRHLASFLSPESAHVLETLRARPAAVTRERVVQLDFAHKDGKIVHAEVYPRGYFDEAGTLVSYQGVTRDITKRMKAERELRWKTALLEAQINSSLDGILVVDDQGRKVLQNKRSVDIWKIPKHIADDTDDRVQGRHLTEMVKEPQEFLDKVRFLKAHPTETSRDEIELKDGTVLDRYSAPVVGPDGVYYGRVWTVRDITDRKIAEEALRRKTGFLEALVHSSHDGILVADDRGRIILQNRRTADLWNIPEEIAEQNNLEKQVTFVMNMVKGDPHHFQERALMFDSSAKDSWHGEVELIDGTVLDRDSYPVEGADGEYYGRLWTFHDITKAKRARESLLTSQLQLSEAANLARIAYWEHDEATGEFVFNDTFYALYGTTAEQEGGYRMPREEYVRRFVHPDDIEELGRRIEENRAHPRAGDLERYEHRAIRKDGQVIYILTQNKIVMDPEGRVLKAIGMNQDITARKKMEESLRENEERYRTLFESSLDGIMLTRPDGTIIEANGRACEMLRMTEEEIRHAGRAGVVVDDERLRAAIAGRTETGNWQGELTFRRSDGSTFPVEISSNVFAGKDGKEMTAIVVRDITERRQAEEAVRASEQKFRAAFMTGLDGVYLATLEEGLIIEVNDQFEHVFGYAREEVLGKTSLELNLYHDPADRARTVSELKTKGRIKDFEVKARMKSGQITTCSLSISVLQVDNKAHILGIIRDITEQKKLEAQLRQAQKMEAVGTLAGGVAHDFNNILTVIMGLGNLMQMSIDKDDVMKAYVDQIVASSERAADLTQSLLAFSRKQRIAPEAHTVNGVVTSTAKLLARLLPEDIGLKMDLTDKRTSSLLDVAQIGQVLMNLATNARDAMPHGGSLTITTQLAKIDEDFTKTHGFGRAGEYVKLSVSDNGAGMDEPTMKRIFEPFFTTKEVGKGTGLGLASAYGIVKQHGGYITVSSSPSRGTAFDIYLPLLKTPSRQKARVKGDLKGGTETILIVEDDRDVRSMLTKILESQGYTTIEAVDGDDAISIYDAHKEKVDLIILDVVMPGKNGKEALDEITRTNPFVKAIFVSGYTGDVVIDKGIQSDGVDFLQKPLTVQGLLGKVREVLDR